MSKFIIGDRVRFIGQRSVTHHIAKKVGTVVWLKHDISLIGVDFDNKVPMCHDLNGLCEDNHGWWCWEDELELINEEPHFNVIITSVGDVTTAKLLHGKKPKKEVTVKRYFKAGYSEKTAVEAVRKKLFGEDKPDKEPGSKGINCKAVCIGNKSGFTRGAVYQFIDGRCIDDQGYLRPIPEFNLHSVIDENEVWFAEDFVKLVGTDE